MNDRKLSHWVLFAGVILLLLVGCSTSVVTPLPPTTTPLAALSTSTHVVENTISPSATHFAGIQATNTAITPPTATEPLPTIAAVMEQPTPAVSGVLKVHFIDVGQGDAILITAPDGKTALIDGGETDSGVVQYLKNQGVQKIDLMIATHPHSDHIGGLVQVLRTMPVAKVVTNGQPHTTKTYENFLDGIASAKAEYVEVKRGDTIALGGLTFDVLSPTSTSGDMNNNSVVLKLAFGKTTFLFMGDAQKEAEASILAASIPVKADILKVGHHGSRTSSTPSFLAQVKPTVAVYSAGIGNSYGHPHPETIAALTAVGAQIYGTDVNGTIIVTADASGYKLEVGKEKLRAPPTAQPTSVPVGGAVATEPATPVSGPLTLEIASVTSPVKRGASATLTAKTAPGVNCTIIVYYKSGPSKASGLGPKTADAEGNVSWTWKVGTTTSPGTWGIFVTATLGDQTVTQETTFTVQ